MNANMANLIKHGRVQSIATKSRNFPGASSLARKAPLKDLGRYD